MASTYIRKRKRKDGSVYVASVDLGKDPLTGKRKERSETFHSRHEAKAALARWQAELNQGTFADRTTSTVADLLTYWLDTYVRVNLRANTIDQYANTITCHIIPALGAIPLQKLTPAHLQQFYADKLAHKTHPRVVRLCHMRLRQALDMALKQGIVARNVADAVTPPRVPQRDMEIWTRASIQRFLAEAHKSGYGPIWLVLLTTAMRRGEVLGLRWRDVDLERGILTVRQQVTVVRGRRIIEQPKSRSGTRQVPIPAAVTRALREHRERQDARRRRLGDVWQDNNLVFTSEIGTPIGPRNLDRDFRRWVERSGVPRIRIHDLRHTVISLSLDRGVSIKALSQHAGHAQTSVTMDVYAHVLPHQRREVADAIGAIVLGEDEPGQGERDQQAGQSKQGQHSE